MVNIMKQNNAVQANINEYVADTPDDIKDLPTKKIQPGSICIVVSTSQVYMLNGEKEWVELQ